MSTASRNGSTQGRASLPDSLQRAESPRAEFDHARDPYISAQLGDLNKTEAERRARGQGSEMVKRDKPFPELTPDNDNAPRRAAFSERWRAEQDRANGAARDAFDLHQAREAFGERAAHSPGKGRSR